MLSVCIYTGFGCTSAMYEYVAERVIKWLWDLAVVCVVVHLYPWWRWLIRISVVRIWCKDASFAILVIWHSLCLGLVLVR